MVKQELLDKLTEIGTCEDDVQRRTLIATLSDEAGNDYDSFSQIEQDNKDLRERNDKLTKANMDLFLQVNKGGNGKPDPVIENKPEVKKSFGDLFNEKGELK